MIKTSSTLPETLCISGGVSVAGIVTTELLFGATNPIYKAIFMFVMSGGALALGVRTGSAFAINTSIGLLGSTAFYGIRFITGGTITINNCKKPIYYKPESGTTPVMVMPGITPNILKRIDGIATPYHRDKVYKVPNMCCVVISEDGDIALCEDISRKVNAQLPANEQAGWYDAAWIEQRPGWEKLLHIIQ